MRFSKNRKSLVRTARVARENVQQRDSNAHHYRVAMVGRRFVFCLFPRPSNRLRPPVFLFFFGYSDSTRRYLLPHGNPPWHAEWMTREFHLVAPCSPFPLLSRLLSLVSLTFPVSFFLVSLFFCFCLLPFPPLPEVQESLRPSNRFKIDAFLPRFCSLLIGISGFRVSHAW